MGSWRTVRDAAEAKAKALPLTLMKRAGCNERLRKLIANQRPDGWDVVQATHPFLAWFHSIWLGKERSETTPSNLRVPRQTKGDYRCTR